MIPTPPRGPSPATPPLIREALPHEFADIVALVNRSYRPGVEPRGWTHESDLLAGVRTDLNQVMGLFSRPDSTLLVGVCDGQIVSCVHVQKFADHGYIGMLAVHPGVQGKGWGGHLLQSAEAYARDQLQACCVELTVIAQRGELVKFYLDRGYQLTGREEVFPLDANVGEPRRPDLKLLRLSKSLR